MKLTLSSIRILPEGQQVKNAILAEYDSIEEFVERNNLRIYAESVKNYTRKKTITSTRFKYYLTMALDKSYTEIVLNPEQQITKYVDHISDNIKEYREDPDIEILEKLKDMCHEYKMTTAEARMYRAIAMYHFYRNKFDVAVELLKVATNMMEGRNENSLIISYKSELGLIYFYAEQYDKAKDVFDSIHPQLASDKDIDNEILFLHYYRYGILYNNMGKHEQARKLFEESLSYVSKDSHMGLAVMNLGLTYKRQGKLSKALGYYKKALEHFNEDDKINHSVVYNNIAEIYKLKGKYDTALSYVKKAFRCLEGKQDTAEYFISFYTYSEIKILKGELEETLNELLCLLSKSENIFLYRKFLIEGIAIIYHTGITLKDKHVMQRLEEIVIKFIKDSSSKDEEYRNSLILYLGYISLFTKEGGDCFEKKNA